MSDPPPGSRVSVRYRTGGGHTDVIGLLLTMSPEVVVRTAQETVSIDAGAIVSVRELSAVPVRNSEIRALEHAAALAWPGTEQHWCDGWLLRAGGGSTARANSAVPLDFSATTAALPAIRRWYAQRDLPPLLAVPERLTGIRAPGFKHTRVMVADLAGARPAHGVRLAAEPDAAWLACYQRDVAIEVLRAVVGGEVVFASIDGVAVGRGAVTDAPDGTRWLGISAVRVDPSHRRRGRALEICAALRDWGVRRGARRVYVQVLADNLPAVALYTRQGFGLHHRHRYVDAGRGD